ncbi:MAG: HlyD family efflux transporter periplasmic adaptor subunit [Aquificaceae bacterium]
MRRLGLFVLLLLLFIFSFLSYRWIRHRMDYAITDAVFVRSKSMSGLAFEVSGKVVEVYKDMGDRVKRGEVLARIEPEDYQLRTKALRDELLSLDAKKSALELQIKRLKKQTELKVKVSEDSLREIGIKRQALLRQMEELDLQIGQLERDRKRLENLLMEGLIPRQRFEHVDTQYKSLVMKKGALEESLKELDVAYHKTGIELESSKAERMQVEELRSQLIALERQRESLSAQLKKAELDMRRVELTSPFDGVVAKRFVNVGDVVRAGQLAFSIIEEGSYHVEALLEETKLRGIKVGSKAYIRLDAYPREAFEGVVEEISPASAATFALVPRDVSAGEFTKVVQRIPVRIKIVKGDLNLLRIGMGGRVEIKRE